MDQKKKGHVKNVPLAVSFNGSVEDGLLLVGCADPTGECGLVRDQLFGLEVDRDFAS